MYNATVALGGKDRIKVVLIGAQEFKEMSPADKIDSVHPPMVEVSCLHWGRVGNAARARAFRLNEEMARKDGSVHQMLHNTLVIELMDHSNLGYTAAPINVVTGVYGPKDSRPEMLVHPKLEDGKLDMQWFPRAPNVVTNY